MSPRNLRSLSSWLPVLLLAAVTVAAVITYVAGASMPGTSPSDDIPAAPDPWAERRRSMVEEQIRRRGVRQEAVLEAMMQVPRHRFVPESYWPEAYADHPLPIGWGQTISQPYIVALMTELLALDENKKVLEVGTGSGYHAAVMGQVAGEVYSVEIVGELARQSGALLQELGYDNVQVRAGDGYDGWSEAAPFDAVILTAAPPRIPEPLIQQLAPGGRMVLPLGESKQELLLLEKTPEGLHRQVITPVRFVPMTGKVQKPS